MDNYSMSQELPKTYDPKAIEDNYYKTWEDRGYFEIDGNKAIQKEDKHFAIMMPPPNVTGRLHIGHSLTFTLQDIMTRYKRMDGYQTLWQPGTDHAGIATQNVVEKQILAEGLTKEELGREKFLERVWSWKQESGDIMVHQMRKLGVSPAWSRERFTMDEGLKESVKEAFIHLYNEGMIIRGNYMVNWCTHDGALSDIEVEHEEYQGKFYHMKYPFSDGSGELVVATTRPETYFGDTAVMVHPDDERYKAIVGKKVTLPLINREIAVITDEHVDMEFGTGVVKVTPAHDTNDYEVGKRHDLEFITVFNESGILNDHAGEFSGLERMEARESIVKRLEEEGFIEKIEDHVNQVGHCYRCKNVVEPYISKQWFVRSEVAKGSIEKTNEGLTKFFPPHWINSYNAWMGELRDWCISRQLWWGHRIPVFYCDECGHEWATKEDEPASCPHCSSTQIRQDPDVLDTWFSSALWPFSTLGWGNNGQSKEYYEMGDLDKFYPNSLLITGFDILFFWVARMMMMGETFQGKLPFDHIYLHALVRDENGQKMSKSKGNVIDPLDMVEEFSADTLRFTLAILAVQGRDIRLSHEKLELSRNFTNKLFNAAKFLLMNETRFENLEDIEIKTELGRYMQHRLSIATKETRKHLDEYRFNDAATTLYRYLWGEFCDWGIELSKVQKESVPELGALFKESLKLLHPFMPFISENLFQTLSNTSLDDTDSIMIQSYPENILEDKSINTTFDVIMDAIVSIRRAKVVIDAGNKKIDAASIKIDNGVDQTLMAAFVQKLAKVETVTFVDKAVENAVSDVSEYVESYIPTNSIDISPIIERLERQQGKLEKEIAKLSGMLNNKKFVDNAPTNVVEENKATLASAQEKLEKVERELNALK
jgi:valyl-tRNA synthetase